MKIVAAEPMQGEPVQGLRSLDDGFIPPIIDSEPARPQDLRHQPRRGHLDAQAARRGGAVRGRLVGCDRPRGGPHRGRDGRGQRRLHRLRRRLEVPLERDLHAARRRGREPRLDRLVVDRMPNVGPMELVIVLAIALIVLGPEEAARGRPLDRQRHARVQGLALGGPAPRRRRRSPRAQVRVGQLPGDHRAHAARSGRRPRPARRAERVLRARRRSRRAGGQRARGREHRREPASASRSTAWRCTAS